MKKKLKIILLLLVSILILGSCSNVTQKIELQSDVGEYAVVTRVKYGMNTIAQWEDIIIESNDSIIKNRFNEACEVVKTFKARKNGYVTEYIKVE